MIGETLEKHCEEEFNKLRATGFQMHTLRKTMMLEEEVKVTTYIENLMIRKMKLYQLCLK